MKYIKKLAFLTVMCTLFLSIPAWAAGNNEGLKINGLSPLLTVQEGAQKTLLSGSATDLKTAMESYGVMNPKVYQIRYKKDEDYRYALAVQGTLSTVAQMKILGMSVPVTPPLSKNSFFKRSGSESSQTVKTGEEEIKKLVSALNVKFASGEFSPILLEKELSKDKRGNTFQGKMSAIFMGKAIAYKDVIYVSLYNDKYRGPSFIGISFNEADEDVLWPLLSPILDRIGR